MIKRFSSPWVALATFAVTTLLLPAGLAVAQSGARAAAETQQRLVTTGRLIRSGQARNGTARFALLNETGDITAYVVPSAGLSLGSYVNEQVAVTARRVSRGADGLTYLLAQGVTPMDAVGTDALGEMSAGLAGALSPVGELPPETPLPSDVPQLIDDVALAGYEEIDPLSGGVLGDYSMSPPPAPAPAAYHELERVGSSVRPVAHQVEGLPFEVPYEEMPGIADYDGSTAGSYLGYTPSTPGRSCSTCGQHNVCGSACCPCGPAGRLWIRGEYLLWWPKGMDVPVLVTTSTGNPTAQTAGVLGNSGTSVLFGGNEILKESRNGGRFRIGKWLDACQWRGFEVDYFFIENASESFSRTSAGNPILARPFFNTQLNAQDAELVAFPGVVAGTINVAARSDFDAFSPRFRFNLACRNYSPDASSTCGTCNSCGDTYCRPVGGSRVDFTAGYRYMRLDESLQISEQLTSAGTTPTTFDLSDVFDTNNQFHGAELGLVWEGYRGPWSMELVSRFALGNNRRKVRINGSTVSSVGGNTFTDVGGLLALSSNIGDYRDDEFVVIPELAANIGYQIAPNLRFLVGYTFIYWSNVVRPGEQIDLNMNPDLLPPVVATTGQNAPAFSWNDSNYWLQGLNFGLDWRW
ncbi:MAG: BBP7 family outer membrane beta-barrel protein [Planctomycetales bacterium]|nr:BBP7 family outer membrane beta-barrel protein [Planctomycetales bacterium]